MKITIDTKKDTREEIKRIIELLSQFTEEKIISNTAVLDPAVTPQENLLRVLDTSKSSEKKDSKRKADEEPEIEIY